MRLLNTCKDVDNSYHMEEFPPGSVPPYAILSHTWANDEVLYTDIKNHTAEFRDGYRKLEYTCEQAKRDNLAYAWIDTRCIDKRSSAELSEAINSMFFWHSKAEKCYAYIADVQGHIDTGCPESGFHRSKWFTRGWTLQELLAPPLLIFYSENWERIGQKITLSGTTEEITGIDEGILMGMQPIESASIAKRMSWAARRVTTRPEDIAYSLMGIFSVNMPMLYGEGGEKAFSRLQEEIIKFSDDQSIFAWTNCNALPDSNHGLLARAPTYFFYSKDIVPYQDHESISPFSMSNRGLQIDLHLTPIRNDAYVAAIDCPVPPKFKDSTFLAIYLKKIAGDRQYARIRAGHFGEVHGRGSIETIFVRQRIIDVGMEGIYPQHVFQLCNGPPASQGYKVIDVVSPTQLATAVCAYAEHRKWIGDQPFIFKIHKGARQLNAAILLRRDLDDANILILLGSRSDFQPAFDALDPSNYGLIEKGKLHDFARIEECFNPKILGAFVELEYSRVRVYAHPTIHAAIKNYMVDIEVEAFGELQVPTVDPLKVLPKKAREQLQRKKISSLRRLQGIFKGENGRGKER